MHVIKLILHKCFIFKITLTLSQINALNLLELLFRNYISLFKTASLVKNVRFKLKLPVVQLITVHNNSW